MEFQKYLQGNALNSQRPVILVLGKASHLLVPSLCSSLLEGKPAPQILWMGNCEKSLNRLKFGDKSKSQEKRRKVDDKATDEQLKAFIRSYKLHFCTYNNADTVLGRTFSIGIYQNFNYITANVLARVVETIQGGGLIIFLIEEASTLKEFVSMSMEWHKRYTTPSHPQIVPLFNSRFLRSLAMIHQHFLLLSDSGQCLVHDDVMSNLFCETPSEEDILDTKRKKKLLKLKKRLKIDAEFEEESIAAFVKSPISRLLNHCKTWDQAHTFSHLVDIIQKSCYSTNSTAGAPVSDMDALGHSNLPLSSQLSFKMKYLQKQPFVVALTAARGRGKSALLGLTIAAGLISTRGNAQITNPIQHVVVTAPCLENVSTVMYFFVEGLKMVKLKENVDFSIRRKDGAIDRVAVSPNSQTVDVVASADQIVEFVNPWELRSMCQQLGSRTALSTVDLLCIDEAAAIPLETVKDLIWGLSSNKVLTESSKLLFSQGVPRVILSSTVNGYEGTGRSLTLKLIDQLRRISDVGVSSQSIQSEGVADVLTLLSNTSSSENIEEINIPCNKNKGRVIHELQMTEPIRYGNRDSTEAWLYHLLCLDASDKKNCQTKNRKQKKLERKQLMEAVQQGIVENVPSTKLASPQLCQLYYVEKFHLFSSRPESEYLLQEIMNLFVTSHYKNSPNDLQLICDAPAHHLFCLFSPAKSTDVIVQGLMHAGQPFIVTEEQSQSFCAPPKLICAIQLCLEGGISPAVVKEKVHQSVKPSGDLIPWALVNQFFDHSLASLLGARVVRIATHPDYQSMGYGSRALQLLIEFLSKRAPADGGKSIRQVLSPVQRFTPPISSDLQAVRADQLPPLLTICSELECARSIDFIGVSFGSTASLYRFWSRAQFLPISMNQTKNPLTNEINTILLRQLQKPTCIKVSVSANWAMECNFEFSQRFCRLLCGPLLFYHPKDALCVIKSAAFTQWPNRVLTADEAKIRFSDFELARLQSYVESRCDLRAVRDQFVELGLLYFTKRLPKNDINFYEDEEILLVSMGLQGRTLNETQTLMKLPSTTCLHVVQKVMHFLTELYHSGDLK